MDYILTTLLSYLLLYKYAAIFVVVLVSGFLLPLPSNTLLMAAGAFASQGYMSAAWVFIVALVSNVLGDCAGYAVTRIWGTRFVSRERLARFKWFTKIEDFVRTYSRLTILVTRFLGTPGSLVNFLCGLIPTPFGRFVLYDTIGNALDTALFLAAGYMLGTFSESFSDIATLVGWIVVILVVIFLIVKLFIRKKNKAV